MSFETIKVHLHYGGSMKHSSKKYNYVGGSVKSGIVIDPDYMTWSMFDGFCEDYGIGGVVVRAWYKLPKQSMESVLAIFEHSSDIEINKMCNAAMEEGEVDIYLENKGKETDVEDVGRETEGEPVEEQEIEVEKGVEVQTEGEEAEREQDVEREGVEAESEGEPAEEEQENDSDDADGGEEDRAGREEIEEDVVEEVLGQDDQFQAFYDEIRSEENHGSSMNQANVVVGEQEGRDEEEGHDEVEFERQCMDDSHPAPAVDTDDEWEGFNRQEREISRDNYNNENPPYLWLLQKFKSGEEFKEQLLRYVLKTNYDVKLCRWEKTKLAAVCTKADCKWKIYCSVEKRIGKWIVKSYVDKHNHMKSCKARMLKQNTIACLFKDEARRRPGIKWTDIKDEIIIRYNLSVSKWICRKARRLALDMVIETQRDQFLKLWDYEAELRRSNENTSTAKNHRNFSTFLTVKL